MQFTVRPMTAADRDYVLPRVESFYHSNAVSHDVPKRVLRRSFEEAVSASNPLIEGFLFDRDGEHAGYAYITHLYSTEAGRCIMIEELFIEPALRRQGLGHAFFNWLFARYPEVDRFRLEVTPENRGAAALYEQLGFTPLTYRQLVRE